MNELMDEFEGEYPYKPGSDGYERRRKADAAAIIAIEQEASLLTLTQAAALLGVTAATLRQQIANGRLKARKVGRDWTVSEHEVERYRRESLRA